MNLLGLHIEFLLRRYPCVIMPGVGAFMVERIDAIIDTDRGVVLPPTRQISFNACINHDDGLLASSYARHIGCSFEAARSSLSTDIADFRETLSQDREVAVGRLGLLELSDSGELCFSPASTPSAEAAMEGLFPASLRVDSLESTSTEPADISVGIPETYATAAYKEEATSADIASDEENAARPKEAGETSDSRYLTLRIRKSWLSSAAAIMICCLLAATLWRVSLTTTPGMRPAEIQQASVLPIASESKPQASAMPVINDDQDTPLPLTPSTEPTMSMEADTDAYYLIVATFHNVSEARKFVESRNSAEWPLKIIKGTTVYRVSAATASESLELRRVMQNPEFASKFPQPWIWHSER